MYTEGRVRQLTATVPPSLTLGWLCSPGADNAVARPLPSEQTRGGTHTVIAQRCTNTHRIADAHKQTCQTGVG